MNDKLFSAAITGEPVTLNIDLGGGAAVAGDADVPELHEGVVLDLPEGAVLNPDGSVTLTFDAPAVIAYRPMGGGDVKSETFDHFVLRRMKGKQMRRVMDAKGARSTNLALSICTGISEAKLTVLYGKMEAPDLTAARRVVTLLIDATDADGLPERAEQHDDGSITLPLLYPASDGDDQEHSELVFQKLKAEALVAMQNGKDALTVGLHRATGLTLKAAAGLLDEMDAADMMATQRVIGFLSGIGRKTGG